MLFHLLTQAGDTKYLLVPHNIVAIYCLPPTINETITIIINLLSGASGQSHSVPREDGSAPHPTPRH